jgi:plastocyanin
MTQSSLLRLGILLGGVVLLGVGCPARQPTPSAGLPIASEPVISVEPVESPAMLEVSPAASAPVPSAAATEVMITALGFTPATVTVPVGATVVFQNADTKSHWVASNPHPVHTGLPGFDAGKPIVQGDSYTFTFTTPGTFGYHDHLHTELHGTVVVK